MHWGGVKKKEIGVLDASAAADVLLQGAGASRFGPLLEDADWVLAPSLYAAELSHVFWKYHAMGALERDRCEDLLEKGMALPDAWVDDRELQREAFDLACRRNVLVYDMLYLVLARRHAANLLTADRKLKKLAGAEHVKTA